MAEAAEPTAPVPFLAAAAALETVNQAVKDAWKAPTGTPTASSAPAAGPRPALAALLMLREVREQLAGWEAGLIENARGQGAGWAYLAGALGVPAPHGAGEQDQLVGVLFGEPAHVQRAPGHGHGVRYDGPTGGVHADAGDAAPGRWRAAGALLRGRGARSGRGWWS